MHRTKLAGIDVNDIVTASYFVPSNVRDAEREREREREGESVRLASRRIDAATADFAERERERERESNTDYWLI